MNRVRRIGRLGDLLTVFNRLRLWCCAGNAVQVQGDSVFRRCCRCDVGAVKELIVGKYKFPFTRSKFAILHIGNYGHVIVIVLISILIDPYESVIH